MTPKYDPITMAVTLTIDSGGSYSADDILHIDKYLDNFPDHYQVMIGSVMVGMIFKTKDNRWVTTRTYSHRYSSFQNALEGICRRLHGLSSSS